MIYQINKLKNKNHRIILKDTEKDFDKIQHPFMIKSLQKNGYKRKIRQHNKGHIWQVYSQLIFNFENLKAFYQRSGTRQGCPLLPLLLNVVLEVLATTIRQEKEIKWPQFGKEEVKLPLFADDMILYVENPEDATKKLLELINELSKFSGYEINIQ